MSPPYRTLPPQFFLNASLLSRFPHRSLNLFTTPRGAVLTMNPNSRLLCRGIILNLEVRVLKLMCLLTLMLSSCCPTWLFLPPLLFIIVTALLSSLALSAVVSICQQQRERRHSLAVKTKIKIDSNKI